MPIRVSCSCGKNYRIADAQGGNRVRCPSRKQIIRQRPVREMTVRFAHHQVIVIGNPGRGDDYDPLYTRKAKIVGGRPDEFQVDIELKPGYSGGPICLADTVSS